MKSTLSQKTSTLLLVLTLVGYPVATIVFSPLIVSYGSRCVTVPFRAICLGLSIIVVLMNGFRSTRNTFGLWMLVLLWICYSFRIAADCLLGGGGDPAFDDKSMLFTFLICTPALVASVSSSNSINYVGALKYSFYIGSIAICASMFINEDFFMKPDGSGARVSVGDALNTISFGMFCVQIFLMGLAVIKFERSYPTKCLAFCLACVGLFCALKAGSRGPIIALIFASLFWMLVKSKNPVIGAGVVGTLLCVVYLFSESIMEFISQISPIFVERWQAMQEGDSSGRDYLYKEAWGCFLSNPLFGTGYSLPSCGQNSHNVMLDILMALGFSGGFLFLMIILIALKRARDHILTSSRLEWICILFLTELILLMTSSPLYNAPVALSLMAIIFTVKPSRTTVVKPVNTLN